MRSTTKDEEKALEGLLLVRSPSLANMSSSPSLESPARQGTTTTALVPPINSPSATIVFKNFKKRTPLSTTTTTTTTTATTGGRWEREIVPMDDTELFLFRGLEYFVDRESGMMWLGGYKEDGVKLNKDGKVTSAQLEWLVRLQSCKDRGLPLPRKPDSKHLARRGKVLMCTERFMNDIDWSSKQSLSLQKELESDIEAFTVDATSSFLPRNGISLNGWSHLGGLSKISTEDLVMSSSSSVLGSGTMSTKISPIASSSLSFKNNLNQSPPPTTATSLAIIMTNNNSNNNNNTNNNNPTPSPSSLASSPSSFEMNNKRIRTENTIIEEVDDGKEWPIWPETSLPNDFCRCHRSHCLKRYCTCFARQNHCSPLCTCLSCKNRVGLKTEEWENAYKKYIQQLNEKPLSCHCSGPTHCLKRYCECYNGGVSCGALCTCNACKNTDEVNAGISPV